MGVEIWEAALGAAGLAGSSGLGALFTRSKSERAAAVQRALAEADEHREGSAALLAKAYGELVDDLREDIRDSRGHIDRQAAELKELRNEIRAIRAARDTEINALREELAAVRNELATSRSDNSRLRERVATLERELHAPG